MNIDQELFISQPLPFSKGETVVAAAAGTLTQDAAFDLVERQNNVALEVDITLRVIKAKPRA